MSDLVERLRDGVRREASGHSALWDSIMAEAADEIERLTAEVSKYREALGFIKYASHTHHAVEMAEAALRGEFPAHDKQRTE